MKTQIIKGSKVLLNGQEATVIRGPEGSDFVVRLTSNNRILGVNRRYLKLILEETAKTTQKEVLKASNNVKESKIAAPKRTYKPSSSKKSDE